MEVSLSALRGRHHQVIIRDISQRKRREALLAGENRVLEMAAKGDSLADILDNCALVEEQSTGVLARSYQWIQMEAIAARRGAESSESLYRRNRRPDHRTFCRFMRLSRIPRRTSDCVRHCSRSIMGLFSRLGFSAFPSRSLVHTDLLLEGKVIGMFAMYYHEPCSPSPREQETITHITISRAWPFNASWRKRLAARAKTIWRKRNA